MRAFEEYGFSAINLKRKVAVRFRSFSRQVAPSHSDAMELMLDFFEYNELSPNDNLGIKSNGVKKRINALIAIIKNIEKNQIKPTKSMLDAIFQEVAKETNANSEKDIFESFSIDDKEASTFYRKQSEILQSRYHKLEEIVQELTSQLSYVKNTFGTDCYKLQLTKNDYESFKQRLENVYHHHSTKN